MKISDKIIIDTNGLRVIDKKGNPVNNNFSDIVPIEKEYFQRAKKFVSLLKKSKRINYNFSSYGIKHRAEDYLNYIAKYKYKDTYVSNGALICAMISENFEYKCFDLISLFDWERVSKNEVNRSTSLNVCFNVYTRQIRELDKQYRK